MINNKNELVVKANRLIEASYRLTLAEQRIILFAITEARRTQGGLNADSFVEIQATEYGKVFGLPKNQTYEQIKEASLTLYERGFVLHDTDPKSGKSMVIKARWTSAVAYVDGEGVVKLRFSHEVIPYITRLESEFTRYKLEKIADMNSPYAIRLYELFLQWGSAGQREIELLWLKKILVLDDRYTAIKDLKKYVIDVAVTQINQHSDLTCSYTQRKTGRNVTHLTFNFDRKPEAKAATEPKTKPVIKHATKPTVQSAAPNPTGTSNEVKQALRELLAARKKITPPEIKTKPEPPATSSPARSLASIMNELKIGDTPINPALAPGF